MRTPGWDWQAARMRCRREAARYLRDPVAAEDVVQEALLRAWRGRASCATPEAPIPWLLAITRNEALRWKARAGHDGDVLDPHVLAAVVEAGIADPAETATDRVWLRTAVARLSAPDQRLLRLRYERDMTTAQIAERLGTPEGTVKIRLHRLRTRLRGELQ
ncbi:MAG TPA: sigma-70 family RNA polymerase sigma factor [Solirubrobacteraceae bacterium]|nr:sigma-70 family RNA polymerase sigma factor [Solirubrobacteraceae bacterium]